MGLGGEFVSNPSQTTHSQVQKGRFKKKKIFLLSSTSFVDQEKERKAICIAEPAAPPSVSLGFHLIFQS